MSEFYEIDPYEALIKLALTDEKITALVGTQIDIWHHYGQDVGDWALNSQSLIFVPFGGQVNPDLAIETFQVEARCYGDSPADCGAVWLALKRWSKGRNDYHGARGEVMTNNGKALIYRALPITQPRLLFDEDIRPSGGMPFFSIVLEAEIANVAV